MALITGSALEMQTREWLEKELENTEYKDFNLECFIACYRQYDELTRKERRSVKRLEICLNRYAKELRKRIKLIEDSKNGK